MGREEKKMGALKIYVLHGWTYDTSKWREFITLLHKKCKVELLKIPGLTAKIENPYTVDDYINWLKKELENEEQVVLMGHSNGGRIISVFAALYPEKVSHLILIDSAGLYHNDFKIALKRFIFRNIAKAGKRITKSKLLESLLYKTVGEKDYRDASPVVKKTMENLIKYNVAPLLPNIRSKTLIIWGKNDKVTPLEDGQKMHSLIPGSKIEIVKDARHSPQFTNAKEVSELVISFLS